MTLSQIPIPHTSKRAFSLLAHLGVVTQACKSCTMGFAQGAVSTLLSGTLTCPLVQVLFPVIPTVLKISSVHLLSPKDLYCLPTNHCSHHRAGYKMATPSSKQNLSSQKRDPSMLLPRTEQALRAWWSTSSTDSTGRKWTSQLPPTLLQFKDT